MNSKYIRKDTPTGSLSKYPTRSEWFENSSLGCLKIIGQVTRINLNFRVSFLLEALSVLEE